MKEAILDYLKIGFMIIMLCVMIASSIMLIIRWNIFWCAVTAMITGIGVSFNYLLMDDDDLCDEDEDYKDLE